MCVNVRIHMCVYVYAFIQHLRIETDETQGQLLSWFEFRVFLHLYQLPKQGQSTQSTQLFNHSLKRNEEKRTFNRVCVNLKRWTTCWLCKLVCQTLAIWKSGFPGLKIKTTLCGYVHLWSQFRSSWFEFRVFLHLYRLPKQGQRIQTTQLFNHCLKRNGFIPFQKV